MLNPDYRDILSIFNEEKVEYLVVGAYALAAHGLPRATGVWRALAKFGAPLSDLTEEDFKNPGFVFQIGVSPSRIDILTSIDGVEFSDGWRDRLEIEIEELSVRIIGRGHLIANKKAVARPQDLADVARLESEKTQS